MWVFVDGTSQLIVLNGGGTVMISTVRNPVLSLSKQHRDEVLIATSSTIIDRLLW